MAAASPILASRKKRRHWLLLGIVHGVLASPLIAEAQRPRQFQIPPHVARRIQTQADTTRTKPIVLNTGQVVPVDPLATGSRLRPGDFVITRPPPRVKAVGEQVETALDVEYTGPNAAGDFLRLRPVLLRAQSGMRLSGDGLTYTLLLLVGLRDEEDPVTRKPTPPGTSLMVLADGASAEPRRLDFPTTNGDLQNVTLESKAPGEVVIVQFIPNFGVSAAASDTLPVIRPKVEIKDAPTAMPAWGAGAATIHVGVSEEAGPHVRRISLSGQGIQPTPSEADAAVGQPAVITIRSSGSGTGSVTATSDGLTTDSKPIQLLFPRDFVIASLLGGVLGSVLRSLVKKSRSRSVLTRHFVAGVIMGFLVASLSILGVQVPLPLPRPENPLAVFVTGLLGSLLLLELLAWLSGNVRSALEGSGGK